MSTEQSNAGAGNVRGGASSESILQVDHLCVRFGASEILNNLSFTVTKGSSLAVIGPNGAGKTVLFQALIRSLPSEGTIHWAPGIRIGYVPQKLDVERDVPITGYDFLKARAALSRAPNAAIGEILNLVGISREVGDTRIGTLSGGQFQRLLIAFALLGNPTVLMLDEPTAGIDEPGQWQVNELVRRLQQERQLTILFISHELSVVYRYASEVLCLGRRKFWCGPPRTILTPDLLHEVYGTPIDYHVHDH
jgi:zinc transport system ATP-binding protein